MNKGSPEINESIWAAIHKCSNTNQRFVYLCLPDLKTNQDKIEILPGVEADVLVHGCYGGHGKQTLPTIATIRCENLVSFKDKEIANAISCSQDFRIFTRSVP